jgi:hypothetical protein
MFAAAGLSYPELLDLLEMHRQQHGSDSVALDVFGSGDDLEVRHRLVSPRTGARDLTSAMSLPT